MVAIKLLGHSRLDLFFDFLYFLLFCVWTVGIFRFFLSM